MIRYVRMEWRQRKQFIFFGTPLIAGIIVLIFVSLYFIKVNREVTRIEKTEDMRVLWTRSLPVREGIIDFVALLENPNSTQAAEQLIYVVKVYDESGILIALREGSTFAYPGERLAVFEPNINIQQRRAGRAGLEIRSVSWRGSSFYFSPVGVLKIQQFLDESPARVVLELVNNSSEGLRNQEIFVVVRGADDEVIAASRSVIGNLLSGETRQVFFSWPHAFSIGPTDPALDIFIRPQEFVAQ